jgi:hypothetical protein
MVLVEASRNQNIRVRVFKLGQDDQIMIDATVQNFIGLAYQGKDIAFRFIIKYSSLRPLGSGSIFI